MELLRLASSPELLNLMKQSKPHDYEKSGLAVSLVAHLLIGFSAVFLNFGADKPLEAPIYSVTMEGGKTLGGRSQAAKDDKKSPVAPPKNVSEPEKQQKSEPSKPVEETSKKEQVKEPAKPEEKPDENAIAIEEAKKVEAKKAEEKKAAEQRAEQEKLEQKKLEEKKLAEKKAAEKKEAKKQPTIDVNKEYQRAMQRYLGNSSDAGGTGFGAAKLGGNDMGGGIVKPREFFIYLETLKARLKENWSWFDRTSALIATVEIEISPEGEISSAKIRNSSGNSLFDQSILRAVNEANPVPPPPRNVYNDFKLVNIVFDPRER